MLRRDSDYALQAPILPGRQIDSSAVVAQKLMTSEGPAPFEEGRWCRRAPLLAAIFPMVLYARLLRSLPFESDDFQWVYQRIPGYLDALGEGQFPPRLFPHAFEGAGYAFPHFYPPISHWVAAGFAALTGSTVWGVHLSFYASVVLASLAMFWLARTLTGSPLLGLVAAVIYTAFPYHAVDVFLRGALAESWSFVWFPLIVHSGVTLVRTGRINWGFPLAVGGLILSHTVMALYFASGCALGLAWVWYRHGSGVGIRLLAGAATGFGLSLWYLLPSQVMLDGVWAGLPALMRTSEEAVRQAAPRPGSLFFLLDLAPWSMVLVTVRLLFQEKRELARDSLRNVSGLLTLALLCTGYAYLPGFFQWLLPQVFAYVQFPWRLFAISGFVCTLLAVLLARPLGGLRMPVFLLIAATTLALPYVLLMGGGKPSAEGLIPRFQANGMTSYTVAGDYLPQPILLPGVPAAVKGVRRQSDSAHVSFRRKRGEVWAMGSGVQGKMVVFPVFFYPLYQAETEEGRSLDAQSRGGFVAVQVPEGADAVVIRVSNPPSFWWGLLVGMVTTAAWFFLTRRDRRRTPGIPT